MPLEGEAALALMKGFRGRKRKYGQKNGLKCPECGEELVDPESVIHLDPPRKRTKCTHCDYKGWREIEEVKPDARQAGETDRSLQDEDAGAETGD